MKTAPDNIYEKIQQISASVKENLKRQGIIVPNKKDDGSIQVGKFFIKKDGTGFYSIVDCRNEAIFEKINLPQTAAIIANKLALGKWVDDDIINADTRYGHALFEETLHKQMAERSLKSNNLDKAEMMFTKYSISKYKKEQHKSEVVKGFEKLMRFR